MKTTAMPWLLSLLSYTIIPSYAFLIPVPADQTFAIVNIEYFTEGKVPSVAQCSLSTPLIANDIQKREPELQCLHVPLLTLVPDGDNDFKQKMADYCAYGQNEKVAKCSDIAELCEKKLDGRVTLASDSCSKEIVHQQDYYSKKQTATEKAKIRKHGN